jgi:hypothetical protein
MEQGRRGESKSETKRKAETVKKVLAKGKRATCPRAGSVFAEMSSRTVYSAALSVAN